MGGNKLSKVGSLITLRSGEGLISFNKHNRAKLKLSCRGVHFLEEEEKPYVKSRHRS